MAVTGEIEPVELKRRLTEGEPLCLLDVREPEEIALAPFPGAVHIPMSELPSRASELDPRAEWIIICHHGIRSAQVAVYLARIGFTRVTNLLGGIDRWSETVDDSIPRY
ncbi:MAG TPA: rhodanese-like domain-containing protein [Candidatus Binataceae bacterium]|nr:rhodanese-like domain-containing protein [Candidatus Binataceae bacterium]